jgi:hypothetical protein
VGGGVLSISLPVNDEVAAVGVEAQDERSFLELDVALFVEL